MCQISGANHNPLPSLKNFKKMVLQIFYVLKDEKFSRGDRLGFMFQLRRRWYFVRTLHIPMKAPRLQLKPYCTGSTSMSKIVYYFMLSLGGQVRTRLSKGREYGRGLGCVGRRALFLNLHTKKAISAAVADVCGGGKCELLLETTDWPRNHSATCSLDWV